MTKWVGLPSEAPLSSETAPWRGTAAATTFAGSASVGPDAGWYGGTPQFKPEKDDGAIALSMFGTADAVAEHTFATVDVTLRLVDRGPVTIAAGTATGSAIASSAAGETAYAAAQSGVAVWGADIVVTQTAITTGSGEASGRSWSSEMSTTNFFALDIEGVQPARGPIVIEATTSTVAKTAPTVPDGNLATFSVDSKVFGDNTFNDVRIEALVVEDQLASVNVSVDAGADDDGPVDGQDPDTFVAGGLTSERITTGNGDDWVFGGGGHDTIALGGGHNTAFGNAGDDQIRAGGGDDWLFGGAGRDILVLGEGTNIGYGGGGDDLINGGSGDDVICDGAGNDTVFAGAGQNTFRLGSSGAFGDGNDWYAAGGGADWYILGDRFGLDVATGFTVRQGDRLVAFSGDWDTDQGLRTLNGDMVTLHRSLFDARDLVVALSIDGSRSSLTLDDFFLLNGEYAAAPRLGAFTDDQALPILRDVFVDGDTDPAAAIRAEPYMLADLLGLLA